MITLGQLLFEAIVSPETVDRNALLFVASAFLDDALEGDEGLPLARKMAAKAMEFAVWGEPAYGALRAAIDAFSAYCRAGVLQQ